MHTVPYRSSDHDCGEDSRADLPPGQHIADRFLRYGTHLFRPIPDVAALTAIEVSNDRSTVRKITHDELRAMPRDDMLADFHCVAGWSVQNLQWSGVRLRTLFATLAQDQTERTTHLRFVGADGFRSVLRLDDALVPDAMLADHLNGLPLGGEHGGPVRLVCPSRYGYKSTKHLVRIELHNSEPDEGHANAMLNSVLKLIEPHPTARVANEERHRRLPAAAVRGPYFRVLHPVFRYLCGLADPQRR